MADEVPSLLECIIRLLDHPGGRIMIMDEGTNVKFYWRDNTHKGEVVISRLRLEQAVIPDLPLREALTGIADEIPVVKFRGRRS